MSPSGAVQFRRDLPLGACAFATVPHPADNALSPARELLGRTLVFDPRLSGSNWIACASCHNPGFSWGDGLPPGDAARRGFAVFNEEGRCAKCHSGWRFTDDSFHDIGVVTSDPGRGALLTNIPVMRSAFKTPTLRNVDRRAPYLHNGSAPTLEDVIELYDRGGLARRDSLSPEVVPLDLTIP